MLFLKKGYSKGFPDEFLLKLIRSSTNFTKTEKLKKPLLKLFYISNKTEITSRHLYLIWNVLNFEKKKALVPERFT